MSDETPVLWEGHTLLMHARISGTGLHPIIEQQPYIDSPWTERGVSFQKLMVLAHHLASELLAAREENDAKDATIKALSLRTSENTVAAKAARQAVTRARYHVLLPAIDAATRRLGYAIGLHGSETRDFDLIAVPWTSEAASAEALAEAVRDAAGGAISTRAEGMGPNPDVRAHGRICWSIGIGGEGRYIDLSVMPSPAAALARAEAAEREVKHLHAEIYGSGGWKEAVEGERTARFNERRAKDALVEAAKRAIRVGALLADLRASSYEKMFGGDNGLEALAIRAAGDGDGGGGEGGTPST